jgi:hypothetical protein
VKRLSAGVKLRIVIRLLTTPRGKRVVLARALALESGGSQRSIYRWRKTFLKRGPCGLARVKRLDMGVSKLYASADFERMAVVAARQRHRPRTSIRAEYETLQAAGLRGSYQTFRRTVRIMEAAGIKEKIGA